MMVQRSWMRWPIVCVAAVVGAVSLVGPCQVSAHGDAPAALGALVDDDGQLIAVHTNIGLARPTGGLGFDYLCPAMWGEESLVPLPWRDRNGQLSVTTRSGIYRLEQCPAQRSTLDGWTGRLGPQNKGYAIEYVGVDSLLWDLRGTPRQIARLSGERVVSVYGTEDGVLLGSVQPETQIHRWTQETGLINLTRSGAVGDYIALRSDGPVSFVLSTDNGPVLYQVNDGVAQLVHQATTVIHGPVDTVNGRIVLADGVLSRVGETRLDPVRSVDWRCLVSSNHRVFTCRLRKLYEVNAQSDWSATKVVFELDQLVGPEGVCGQETDTGVTCFRQWLHFGGEAGLVNLTEDVGGRSGLASEVDAENDSSMMTESRSAASCTSLFHGSDAVGAFIFVLMCFLGRYRVWRRSR